MKKIVTLSFISFIICTAFNKPNILCVDYRDSYVGAYFCQRSCQVLNSSHTGFTNSTDTFTINVTKDIIDSTLKLIIKKSIFKVKLKSGFMYAYPIQYHWNGHFFATDSISFTSSIGNTPNLCSYIGKKK